MPFEAEQMARTALNIKSINPIEGGSMRLMNLEVPNSAIGSKRSSTAGGVKTPSSGKKKEAELNYHTSL